MIAYRYDYKEYEADYRRIRFALKSLTFVPNDVEGLQAVQLEQWDGEGWRYDDAAHTLWIQVDAKAEGGELRVRL